MNKVTRFQVKGLHGYKNFDFQLKDNTLILVGENGAGKTTVLRLLYYFISGQWAALAKFKFKELSITIDKKRHRLPYDYLWKNIKDIDKHLFRRLPPHLRDRFMALLERCQYEGHHIYPELEELCDQFEIPFHFVIREIEIFEHSRQKPRNELHEVLQDVRKSFDSQILYLPTYRRIEQELNLIFKDVDEREIGRNRRVIFSETESDTYVELIEFGMRDVDHAIKNTLSQLKDFARENLNTLTLGYLGDVVERKYNAVDTAQIRKVTDNTIKSVLGRIHMTILSDLNKQHLSEVIKKVKSGDTPNEHTKVICHYFLKLLGFQQELEYKEKQISSFCDVCNEYMEDKSFHYDSSSYQFTLRTQVFGSKENTLELQQLSSGEKQIVSLFSHLYLSGKQHFFVLIDEPELSLSVPWQRRFLSDIRKGRFCTGLVAVTHSPFIYDNELKTYARSLGEFMKESR